MFFLFSSFMFALCTTIPVILFTIFANNFGENAHIGTEEGEALHPDEGEGVVTLELQQVGGQQPGALTVTEYQHISKAHLTILTYLKGVHIGFLRVAESHHF
jgi:hypothetical protein